MKKLLFFLFISISFTLKSADWELFPLGQKSYYTYPDNSVTNVAMYLMDSVVSNGTVDSLFFRKKFPDRSFTSCDLDTVQRRNWQWPGMPEFLIDSLIKNSDTTFYYSSWSSTPFYFITSATVGQSWTITSTFSGNNYNQITITCDSIVEESFIGLMDSVKIFSMTANGTSSGQIPVNNFKMRLSKNYGLIEFVPLNRFLFHPSYKDFFSMKLIGIESSSIQAYYKQPEFSEYFDLSPGDILLWDDYVNFIQGPWPTNYHEFLRDSITAVSVYPDSVLYTFDRMKEDSSGTITQTFNNLMRFRRSEIETLVEASPDWYSYGELSLHSNSYPGNYKQYWWTDSVIIAIDSIAGDTITSIMVSTSGNYLELNNCSYMEVMDYGNSIQVNSKFGITYLCDYHEPGCLTLIGSRINGIVNGNISLGVNNHIANRNALLISPNPANDFIKISSFQDLSDSEYVIYNTSGQIVIQSTLKKDELSISDLPTGLYLITLKTQHGIFSIKFVKE